MIHGGNRMKEYFNNLLWFDTATDTFVSVAEDRLEYKPSPRKYHACSYIYANNKIIFFGGETEGGNTIDNNVYILNMTQFYTNRVIWEKSILHKSSVVPPPLKFATLSYHANTGIAILFGGTTHDYQNNNQIYIYYAITNAICNGTWVIPVITGYDSNNLKGRWGHSADMVNNTLIIYGGVIDDIDCESLLCIELVDVPNNTTSNNFVLQVSTPFPTGFVKLPPATHKHSTAVLGNSIYIFGGYDGMKYYNSFKQINIGIEDETQNELKQYCDRYGISYSTYVTLKNNRVSLSSLPYLLDKDYEMMKINIDEKNRLRLNSKVLFCYENNPLLLQENDAVLQHILKNLNFSDGKVDFDKPIKVAKKIVSSGKTLSIDTFETGMKDKTVDKNDLSVLEEKMKLIDKKNKDWENRNRKLKEEISSMGNLNLCEICKSNNKNVLLMPCKCYLYCEGCCVEIMSRKECPHCKKRVNQAYTVFTE